MLIEWGLSGVAAYDASCVLPPRKEELRCCMDPTEPFWTGGEGREGRNMPVPQRQRFD
jgi:hypothetical protein